MIENRREYIRHQVNMPLRIGRGVPDHDAMMKDFCLGGLLVALPNGGNSFLRDAAGGDVVALQFMVETARRPRDITLSARVVRVEDQSLGLAFERPDSSMLLALHNHVRTLLRETPSPDVRDEPRTLQARHLARSVTDILSDYCQNAVDRLVPLAIEALEQSAAESHTNEDQHPFFEAVELLKRGAGMLGSGFVNRAISGFRALEQGQSLSDDALVQRSDERLSLVDKEVFDEWVTLKVMASRAEAQFYDDLLHLQLRLDKLFDISLNARRNPLAPTLICTAFGEAVRQMPFKGKTDRVVLAVFEREVMGQLGTLYADINRLLAEAGVLPNLDVGRYLSEKLGTSHSFSQSSRTLNDKSAPLESAAVDSQDAQHPQETAALAEDHEPMMETAEARPVQSESTPVSARGSQPVGETIAATQDSGEHQPSQIAAQRFKHEQNIARSAYATVRKILERRKDEKPVTEQSGSTADASGAVAHARVDQLLARLQSSQEQSHSSLSEKVSQSVTETEGAAVDEDLHSAVDVIHHLFTGITANPALSGRVREAIRRLEVPFLRLLLHEDAFLDEQQHPARQVLNRMSQLGLGQGPDVARHAQEIEREVDHILDHYQGDVSVFQKSLQALDKLAETQETRFQKNLRRLTEACEGKQKIAMAEKTVGLVLEDRLAGTQVPRALVSLIDAGWRDLLVQTLLRDGRESNEWHHFVSVVDHLLEAVAQPPSQELLKRLLALIKGGLSRVGSARLQDPQLIAEMKALLSQASRETTDPELVTWASVAFDEDEEDAEPDVDPRWLRRAERCEVGDWFACHEHEKEDISMMRLAWIAEDRNRFVFVNHQGMKLQEYTLVALARALSQGLLAEADNLDVPAVDRGLETMVQGIYDQMAYQATHDELTGLVSRREFERRLRHRLGEDAAPGSLLHLDVDNFEVVNSVAGHEAGDDMLNQIATVLTEAFPDCLIGRLAADEFSIWIQPAVVEVVEKQARDFLRQLAGRSFRLGEQPFSITMSCGVGHRDSDATTALELLQVAETTCHRAKEAGKNRMHVYQADDEETVKRNDLMTWITRLNEAIERNRLVLRCQRIEALVGEGLPSYEVLLSVLGDKSEQLSPQEFIHSAERYNRMHAVDRWVIEKVLEWMQRNPEVVLSLDHVSVNLSGHSFNDPGLLEFMFDAFRRYPVPRDRLCFEVTETATIASVDDAIDFMLELRNLGCRFSLDDFGSGLASYGYLKKLPVDYIKIDGSFIRNLSAESPDLALVRSINEMGHLMGKKTIAECVETDEVRHCLSDIGVDFVQGYGVEAPKPLETLVAA